MKIGKSRIAFNIFNYSILIFFSSLIILPFMHVISVSLSSAEDVKSLSVGIFPKGFLLGAYKTLFEDSVFIRSFFNTVFLTIVTTFLSMLVNVLASYSLSKDFYGKKVVNYIFIITMFFSGGLIPSYILITKYLGWFNNYSALIFPAIVSYYTIIIIRSQIESIPKSLVESAYIDGATNFRAAIHVVVPSIFPTIAAMSMFTALATWNQWFGVLIYTDEKELWTLQYFLRAVVIEKSLYYSFLNTTMAAKNVNDLIDTSVLSAKNYEMAAIIVIALPVVVIYPFIQKYFVKGILTGAVKE